MKVVGILAGLLALMWLGAKGTHGFFGDAGGGPAKPGIYREAEKPELTPRPQQADYAPPETRFAAHSLSYGGDRLWYGLGPKADATVPPDKRPPAIVLLHGSNRDGRAMLDMWEGLARREKLTLIAPNSSDPISWDASSDGEDFLVKLLAEAAGSYSFNPQRLYLFGHSAGAIHALYLANRTDGPWRAVAIHGGGLPLGEIRSRAHAIPLRLYVGDHDEHFPVNDIRAEAKALAEAGHDTELIVIPSHDHWYYEIGPHLASHAWNFLRQH
jgi:pimeloyl-ACP methyl ester carboxylesterase